MVKTGRVSIIFQFYCSLILSLLNFTCISGSSGFSSPSCFSLSRIDSQSLWYFRLKISSSWVMPSAPPVGLLDFLTLPSKLGWSSSRSHWNLSSRRSYIWQCLVSSVHQLIFTDFPPRFQDKEMFVVIKMLTGGAQSSV